MSDPAHKSVGIGEQADGRVRSIAWLGGVVRVSKALLARFRDGLEYTVAVAIIVIIAVVVCGACAALVPVRVVIDWSARRERRTPPNAELSDSRPL